MFVFPVCFCFCPFAGHSDDIEMSLAQMLGAISFISSLNIIGTYLLNQRRKLRLLFFTFYDCFFYHMPKTVANHRSRRLDIRTRQMRLASNYSKVFVIDDIRIKFWFNFVQMRLDIWIEINFDSNSGRSIKNQFFQLFNWNYLTEMIDFNQNWSIIFYYWSKLFKKWSIFEYFWLIVGYNQ